MWLYFKEDIIVTECQGKLAQLARCCPARKVKVWCPSSGTQGLYGLIQVGDIHDDITRNRKKKLQSKDLP